MVEVKEGDGEPTVSMNAPKANACCYVLKCMATAKTLNQ